MNYLIPIILCIALAVIILVVIFAVRRPLHRMALEAKRFAEGDYSEPLSTPSTGNLSFISDVMNCMADELNNLEDDQRKFISNISHDFRSPLTSIKGYAEAMEDGTIPVEMQEKYLNVIISETERLEDLTEGILEFNKYSDKGTYLNFSRFDLNEKIRQAILTFEGRANEKI